MSSMSIKINPLVLFVCALFMYPVIIGNIALICYAIVYGTALLYILFNIKYLNRIISHIPSKQFLILIGIIVMLIMSIIIPILLSTNDFTYVDVIVAMFRKMVITLFILILLHKTHPETELLPLYFRYFCAIQCLYVFITIVFLAFPSLKSFWQSVIQEDAFHMNLYKSYGYGARFGWAGFSGYRSTIDCSLGIIFSSYLYGDTKKSYVISFQEYMLITVICFLGNMFYGRTGIIVSSVCFVFALISYHKIKIQQLVGFFTVVILIITLLFIIREKVKIIDEWLGWAITPFTNFISGKKGNRESSVNVIKYRMLFMPEKETFIHGDGYYTDPYTGSYYRRTDLGFMRQILFWGLPGIAISYCDTIFSVFSLKAKSYTLKFMMLICLCIYEFKGDMYYDILPVFALLGICENSSVFKTQKLFSSFKRVGVNND